MRNLGWADIVSTGNFRLETKAVIDNVEYTTITAPVIESGLLSTQTLSVGNCRSAVLKFAVMTTDAIRRAAKVVIKSRVTADGAQYSEWEEFGTFWISTRETEDDMIDLVCYDAMHKCNQVYADPTNPHDREDWPKPMQDVVNEIAQKIGVTVDSRTEIPTQSAYDIPYPENNITLADVLGYIGGLLGGNWIITPENKLRLVPLISPPGDTFYVIDEATNHIETGSGDILVWPDPYYPPSQEEEDNDTVNVPAVLNKLTTSRNYTITRVTMSVDSEIGFTAGTDAGYELYVKDNPYATQALCDALLARVKGIEYAPYTMNGCIYNPAAELGDWVVAGDRVRGVLFNEVRKHDHVFTADITAPGEVESESEFPFESEMDKVRGEATRAQKYAEYAARELDSKIEQTRTEISLSVSRIEKDLYYGEITGENLLLDVDAPTVDKTDEDAVGDRLIYSIDYTHEEGIVANGTWRKVGYDASNVPASAEPDYPPPDGLTYGVRTVFRSIPGASYGAIRWYTNNRRNPDTTHTYGIDLTPGELYTASAYVRKVAGSGDAEVSLFVRTRTHLQQSESHYQASTIDGSDWKRIIIVFMMPTDSSYYYEGKAEVEFGLSRISGTSGTIEMCGFSLTEGNTTGAELPMHEQLSQLRVTADGLAIEVSDKVGTDEMQSEIQASADSIISTVTQQYGEVQRAEPNMLLDTNAPTLAKVDGPYGRTLTTISPYVTGEWRQLNNLPDYSPDDLQYGVKYTWNAGWNAGASDKDTIQSLRWYGQNAEIPLTRGEQYTISCYARYAGFSGELQISGVEARLYFGLGRNNIAVDTVQYATGWFDVFSDEWVRYDQTFYAPTDDIYYGADDKAVVWFGPKCEKNSACTSAIMEVLGFTLVPGDKPATWNDGINIPNELATVGSVESQIYQSAEAIRLKASEISWESDNSSMSKDGKLYCKGAEIDGKFTATVERHERYEEDIPVDAYIFQTKINEDGLVFTVDGETVGAILFPNEKIGQELGPEGSTDGYRALTFMTYGDIALAYGNNGEVIDTIWAPDSTPDPESDWQSPTLASGVTTPSANDEGGGSLRVALKKDGHVVIKGGVNVRSGSSEVTLATLPPECWPTDGNRYRFVVCGGGSQAMMARLYVSTTGNLVLQWVRNIANGGAYSGNVWLDCELDYWI